MNQENKINIELFNSIQKTIKTPFMVLAQNGNIISLNDEASILLESNSSTKNIYDILDYQSAEYFNQLFSEVLSGGKKIEKNIEAVLKSGKIISNKFVLNTFFDDDATYLFCSFYSNENKLMLKSLTNINIVTEKLKEIINNSELIKAVNEVASSYPFTFLQKEKLRNKIDSFSELIWISNNEGEYVLVNNKLSKSFGLKNSQLEGRSECEFILPHLIEFKKAIDAYIQKSINSISLEGIPLKGISGVDGFLLIEIPVTDSNNNVIAIIGVAQKKINKSIDSLNSGEGKSYSAVIYNMPKAVAVFDKEGKFITGSNRFCRLINLDNNVASGLNYKKIFDDELSIKIETFYNSQLEEENFKFDIQAAKTEKVEISFNKIFNSEKQMEGVLMQIEENSSSDDFEKLLSDKGKIFDLLIKNNPEPIFVYAKDDLMFLEVNDAALELYGYNRDEFLKMDLTDLYTTEDIQTLLDCNNQTKEGKFSKPFKHRKKDGSFVFVEISKLSFKSREKDAHFNIIKDVTVRFELQQKQQLFQTSFNNVDDLIFITDSSGFILDVNQRAMDSILKSEDEILNSNFTSFVEDENRGMINSKIFQSNNKDSQTFNCNLKKSNDGFFDVEIKSIPILDFTNEIINYNIIVKIKKQETNKINKGEKNVLQNVNEKSEILKNDSVLLSNVFHELLTPINAIIGFTQEIFESIDKPTQDQIEAIDFIKQNKEALMNSINNVVESSKTEEKNVLLNVENINITDIVEEVNQRFSEIMDSSNVEFAYGKISSSLTFDTDNKKFVRLVELLLNITSKVIGGNKIYFSASQFDEDSFIISFQNSYSKLSEDNCKILNDFFNTSDTSKRKQFGVSKNSLDLSKSLLKILSGKFHFKEDDKIEAGFVFPLSLKNENDKTQSSDIDIPTEKIDESHSQNANTEIFSSENSIEENKVSEKVAAEDDENYSDLNKELEAKVENEITSSITGFDTAAGIDLSQLKCLYIEDQIDSQILFSLQMKDLADIKYAVSFEEALPLLDNNSFDFILIDINILGEYNGLDALRLIHRLPGYDKLPIIAVSSYLLPGDHQKFIAAGFNDFISKPIFRENVIASLDKIFSMQM